MRSRLEGRRREYEKGQLILKTFWNCHMETYYCLSFLKYMHINIQKLLRWSYPITRTVLPLDTTGKKMKIPILGLCFLFRVVGQWGWRRAGPEIFPLAEWGELLSFDSYREEELVFFKSMTLGTRLITLQGRPYSPKYLGNTSYT